SLGLSYASLPVLMKIETAGGKLFVNSGLDFALLLDATASPVDGDGEDEDIKDKFTDFDLAVNFGVGGQFPIGRPRVTIEARYIQSLTNLSDVSVDIGADELVPTRVRSSGFEFLAGIWIPLGGS
ncbi:MAG: outer membrane beta-barrel protein, partial [Gemmatimonadota bacterium]